MPAANKHGRYIPPPRPLKQKIKDGMVALTMATWCFVRPWSHLLFDGNRYFNKLPAARVELLALVVNVACFALLVWLGIGIWRRCRTGMLSLLLDMSFLFLLVFPADCIRMELLGMTDTKLIGLLRQPAVITGLFVILAFLIWKHRLAARTLAMIIFITFPVALLTLARIILLCLNVLPVKACAYSPAPPPLLSMRAGQPRVVWMIFDETDYRLVFEKRPANVPLPEFDRLRQTALSADHACPPGDSTITSMPALISAQRISAADPDGCDLRLTLADTGATVEWSALPSVFSQARELGVNTALVGWYHPYARMLGGSLNYCSWYPFPAFEPSRSTTFGGAMAQQIASLAGPFHVRQVFINTCKGSLADAAVAVANPNYGLILLHLPPPHGPGVYLPEKNEFTCNGIGAPAGYFNNLVLADHELGALRRAMETSGQWDKSWVILSADHSWRISKLYDGVRDYRVPFLVKSPGVSESIAYSHQFNTLMTHDLILAILRGEVTNQASAATLLDRGKPDMPVPGSSAPSTQQPMPLRFSQSNKGLVMPAPFVR
jgi:hypothetical protein